MKNLSASCFLLFLQISIFCSAAQVAPANSPEIAVCNLSDKNNANQNPQVPQNKEDVSEGRLRSIIRKAQKNKKYIAALVVTTAAIATALLLLKQKKNLSLSSTSSQNNPARLNKPEKDWGINVYKYFGQVPRLMEEGRLGEISNQDLPDLIEYFNQQSADPSAILYNLLGKTITVDDVRKSLNKEAETREAQHNEELITFQTIKRNEKIVETLKNMPAAEFEKEKKEIEQEIKILNNPHRLETAQIHSFPKELESLLGRGKTLNLKIYYELIKDAQKLRK